MTQASKTSVDIVFGAMTLGKQGNLTVFQFLSTPPS